MKRLITLILVSSIGMFGCGGTDVHTPDAGGGGPDAATAVDANLGPDAAGTCSTNAECAALSDACNDGTCGPDHTCVATPKANGTVCSDGDNCTTGEACNGGVCTGAILVDCSGLTDACNSGSCDAATGACVATPINEGNACDDGDACTTGESCMAGACAGPPVDCTGLDSQCTAGTCDPATGACLATPINEGGACSDGVACTTGDVCTAGTCAGAAVDCSALSGPCTAGSCNAMTGLCEQAIINEGLPCSDGDACTNGEMCNAGTCGGPASSTDVYFSDDFHDNSQGWTLGTEWAIGPAVASPPSPVFGGAGDPAADHSASADEGLAGVVIGGFGSTAVHPAEYFTSPVVDLSGATGNVFLSFWRQLDTDYPNFIVVTVEAYDGATWHTLFQNQTGVTIKDLAWTYEQYDVTAYKNAAFQVRFSVSVNQLGAFQSPSWSVDDLRLSAESCDATGANCDTAISTDCSAAANQCNTAACDSATGACVAIPMADGTACDDGNACTTADACTAGACVGGAPPVCAGDQCNTGACDPAFGCFLAPVANGTTCDDGNTCTYTDTCTGGMCGGRSPFVEDFSDNAAGWTLDSTWQIGAAMTSSGQNYGNPDPATDTTATADNGVAGVVIGGNAPITPNPHPFYWLTSPVIDTAVVPGSIQLSFQRWLNSDYDPFMHNHVEVFDGATWHTVADYSAPGQTDTGWNLITIAIPDAYKNANMQVRFGYDINNAGVYTVSSWNIDDVRIQPVAYDPTCP